MLRTLSRLKDHDRAMVTVQKECGLASWCARPAHSRHSTCAELNRGMCPSAGPKSYSRLLATRHWSWWMGSDGGPAPPPARIHMDPYGPPRTYSDSTSAIASARCLASAACSRTSEGTELQFVPGARAGSQAKPKIWGGVGVVAASSQLCPTDEKYVPPARVQTCSEHRDMIHDH